MARNAINEKVTTGQGLELYPTELYPTNPSQTSEPTKKEKRDLVLVVDREDSCDVNDEAQRRTTTHWETPGGWVFLGCGREIRFGTMQKMFSNLDIRRREL